jgi:hypothetical protein
LGEAAGEEAEAAAKQEVVPADEVPVSAWELDARGWLQAELGQVWGDSGAGPSRRQQERVEAAEERFAA